MSTKVSEIYSGSTADLDEVRGLGLLSTHRSRPKAGISSMGLLHVVSQPQRNEHCWRICRNQLRSLLQMSLVALVNFIEGF